MEIIAAGHPLAKQPPGRSRTEVEKVLWKPAKVTDRGVIGEGGGLFATYYLQIPNHPGEQLLTARYRRTKDG